MPYHFGRPLKFQSVKQLQMLMDSYFDNPGILKNDKGIPVYSYEELAQHCGCLSETLNEYSKKDDFSQLIKMARQKVLISVIQRQATDKNPAGSIFHGKQLGQTDATQIDHTVTNKTITVQMIGDIDDD
jgi:hypothetical protein